MNTNQTYRDIRVFAEGVRIPARSVSRSQSIGNPLSFTVRIPATPVGSTILPDTHIAVFVRRNNQPARRNDVDSTRETATSRVNYGVEYSLFAEGRVRNRQMKIQGSQGRQVVLSCSSMDDRWSELSLGLSVGEGLGVPLPRLMRFFEGLSARNRSDTDAEEGDLGSTTRDLRVIQSLGARNSLITGFSSLQNQIIKLVEEFGVVSGMAEVVSQTYRLSPLALQEFLSMKMQKRVGLIENDRIVEFVNRDHNIDVITNRIRSTSNEASLFDILNQFLGVSMHEYVSIGSPYYNTDLGAEDESFREGGAVSFDKPEGWDTASPEERLELAQNDPLAQGFLDMIARNEIGPQYADRTQEQAYNMGHQIGFGGVKQGVNLSGLYDHPYADRDEDDLPQQLTLANGSVVANVPDRSGQTIEEGDTFEYRPGDTSEVTDVTTTTASGRYQIVRGSWEEEQEKYDNINGWSPESQERAALARLERRGALDDMYNGNINQLFDKTAVEWAGVPQSNGRGYYANNEDVGNQEATTSIESAVDNWAQYTANNGDPSAAEDIRSSKGVLLDSTFNIMPSMIFKPKTHFEPPPVTNVIFGAEIISASMSDGMKQAPTRMMVKAKPTANQLSQARNSGLTFQLQLHFSPRHLSGIIETLRDGENGDLIKDEDLEDLPEFRSIVEEEVPEADPSDQEYDIEYYNNVELNGALLELAQSQDILQNVIQNRRGDSVGEDLLRMYTFEELFKGVKGHTQNFPFYAPGSEGEADDYEAAAIYGNYQFGLLSKLGRSAQIQTNLNLDIAPGFPLVAYDESLGWVMGRINQIKDSIDAQGSANTNISLSHCTFLSDFINPYRERIHRENESEFGSLDKGGSMQNPFFFDDKFNAQNFGEEIYEPLFGTESIIDFANQYIANIDQVELSIREALEVIRQLYYRKDDGQEWLTAVRFRSIVTEGQYMQKVLEASPDERLVQEGDENIPIKDQVYEKYEGTFSLRSIPSVNDQGQTASFATERRFWADAYMADILNRGSAMAEDIGQTTNASTSILSDIREEVLEGWDQDISDFEEIFENYVEDQVKALEEAERIEEYYDLTVIGGADAYRRRIGLDELAEDLRPDIITENMQEAENDEEDSQEGSVLPETTFGTVININDAIN